MPKVKVALLTESRADYGIYYPLLREIATDSHFEFHLLVGGMHLSREYGFTCDDIEADGFGAKYYDRNILDWIRPDWLIVLGDRRLMLEATIIAAYQNIAVAHIQGGDRSGTIDNSCRHAITRFANLHFPCSQESADRLIKMGEEEWRIRTVGPLGIYALPQGWLFSKNIICYDLGLDPSKEIVLVIQHPVFGDSRQQIKETLAAVKDYQAVIIYPNNDLGSEDMIEEIKASGIKSYPSLPHLQFLSLLKVSDVIVGNSSSGLYEAPLFGVPAVNIGNRQQDREHGEIFQSDYTRLEIKKCIESALKKGKVSDSSPFKSDIDGVKIILDTLYETPLDERLFNKRITY